MDDDSPPLKKRRTATATNTCKTKGTLKKKETQTKSKTTKSKKKVLLKGNEATERLKEFMIAQNRPHSKNSAHSELLGAISVGQIQKSMDALTETNVLVMKEFGSKSKTKIYWANQEILEADEGEEDDEMEILTRIKALEMQVKQKREAVNAIKQEIIQIKKEPTDEELEMQMKKTVVEYHRTKDKLNELRGNQDESLLVSQEDLDEKLTTFYKYGKAWKERKAVVMDMVSQIFQECNDKPDKILTKKLNGETDKENDVNWENYKEIYKTAARLVQQKKDKARRIMTLFLSGDTLDVDHDVRHIDYKRLSFEDATVMILMFVIVMFVMVSIVNCIYCLIELYSKYFNKAKLFQHQIHELDLDLESEEVQLIH